MGNQLTDNNDDMPGICCSLTKKFKEKELYKSDLLKNQLANDINYSFAQSNKSDRYFKNEQQVDQFQIDSSDFDSSSRNDKLCSEQLFGDKDDASPLNIYYKSFQKPDDKEQDQKLLCEPVLKQQEDAGDVMQILTSQQGQSFHSQTDSVSNNQILDLQKSFKNQQNEKQNHLTKQPAEPKLKKIQPLSLSLAQQMSSIEYYKMKEQLQEHNYKFLKKQKSSSLNIDVEKIKSRMIQQRLRKIKQQQADTISPSSKDVNRKKIQQVIIDPAENIFYNTPKGDGIYYNHQKILMMSSGQKKVEEDFQQIYLKRVNKNERYLYNIKKSVKSSSSKETFGAPSIKSIKSLDSGDSFMKKYTVE